MALMMARPHARLVCKRLMQRAFGTSAVRQDQRSMIMPEERDKFYPKIGDREIVGFGQNGSTMYMDHREFPMPAIRFKEDKGEIATLRQKEMGDWNLLTVEDKKTLYRASFCRTFAEFTAPTGEWKSILALVLFCFTFTGWGMLFLHVFVELPVRTHSEDMQALHVIQAVREHQWGISRHNEYDYENKRWK